MPLKRRALTLFFRLPSLHILLLAFTLCLPAPLAGAATGVVHLLNNLFEGTLLRKRLSLASRVESTDRTSIMRMRLFGGLVLATLISCKGPHEEAGERQDQAAANQAGQAFSGLGPAQRVGRARDQAERAAVESQHATKEAVAAESENYRRQVEVEAVRLEEQARELREEADARGDELKAEAAEVAKK